MRTTTLLATAALLIASTNAAAEPKTEEAKNAADDAEARAAEAEARAAEAEARAAEAEARAAEAEARAAQAEAEAPDNKADDTGEGDAKTDGKAKPKAKLPPLSYGGVTWIMPPGSMVPLRRGKRWDLNIELGFGKIFPPEKACGDIPGGCWLGMARLRAGMLLILEPLIPAVGVTAEVNTLQPPRFGLQLESLHLWAGFWVQIGADVDTRKRIGLNGSFGHDLLGVEVQTRQNNNDRFAWTVFGKIRAPIGIIGMELASTEAMKRGRVAKTEAEPEVKPTEAEPTELPDTKPPEAEPEAKPPEAEPPEG